jgi:uncharacterized repeat protein (TIGR04076 family)
VRAGIRGRKAVYLFDASAIVNLVKVCVKKVKGNCTMNYKPGNFLTVERSYISDAGKDVCLHVLSSMLTLLSPLLKGVSAKALDLGRMNDIDYG